MKVVVGTQIEAIGRMASSDPGGLRSPDGGAKGRPPAARQEPPPPVPSPSSVLGDVGLVFEVNPNGRDLVIKIVDRQNNRIIRQIPPEEMQRLRLAMREMAGLLLDQKG